MSELHGDSKSKLKRSANAPDSFYKCRLLIVVRRPAKRRIATIRRHAVPVDNPARTCRSSNDCKIQIGEDRRKIAAAIDQAWRGDRRQLWQSSIEDHDVRLAIETRVIHQAVWLRVMCPQSPRPDAGKTLRACASDVGRNSHPHETIAAQIDDPQRCLDPDLSATPRFELRPLDREGMGSGDTSVSQNCLDKTHLDAATEINDAETLRGNQRRFGIAEPARAETIAKRIREAALVKPPPCRATRDVDKRQRA
jgi:hypothetical protein